MWIMYGLSEDKYLHQSQEITMQTYRQFSEEQGRSVSSEDTIITRDQFIDFVNWLGMSDVVVQEEGNGWFRVQFVETARKNPI